ncbi:unnamed protein product [Amoebophrya sp. A25]|nr:unnamed protein product [Amoebophrya sp. A25]|eukprot:GSA25T00022455001.1
MVLDAESMMPPRPDWLPTEHIRQLPQQWAQRMTRSNAGQNCMMTEAFSWPPCPPNSDNCAKQLWLLQFLKQKLSKSMQDLDQSKLGLRIAQDTYSKALSYLPKMDSDNLRGGELVTGEGNRGEVLATHNIHNLNERVWDTAPLKFGHYRPGAMQNAWNTSEDFMKELDRQREYARIPSRAWGQNAEAIMQPRRGANRFVMQGPPVHVLSDNPYRYPHPFGEKRMGLVPDLGPGSNPSLRGGFM